MHEVFNLVALYVVKHNTNGVVLRHKFWITAADACGRDNSKFFGDTYSGAVESTSIRFTVNATPGRTGGVTRNLDVAQGCLLQREKNPSRRNGRALPLGTRSDGLGRIWIQAGR